MPHTSDNTLWKQIAKGNSLAFQELYDRYIDDLILFGQKLSGNHDLVQDTLQKLFFWIWDHKTKITVPNHTKAYLMKSFRNNLIREIEQEKLISNIDVELHLKDIPGITVMADNTEEIRRLQLVLPNLPPRQREVLHLRFYQNVRNEDIADIMGITHQSVRNLLQRAIKQVKTLMETTT